MNWTKLVDDHWKYVEGILKASTHDEYEVNLVGYHYKTAFLHGIKHALEATKGTIVNEHI
jgi:hypothetical protein